MKNNSFPKIRILKKILKVFVLVFSINTFSGTFVKDTSKLVLIKSDRELSVNQVFNLIRNQTNYKFIYSERHVKNAPKVFLKKGKISVPNLLKITLDPINSTYELNKGTIIVRKKRVEERKQQEEIEVNGLVVDGNDQPIEGISVLIKNTLKGVSTDFDGKFKIKVPVNSTLVFTSIFFFEKETLITPKTNYVKVVLEENISELDEIIVSTGYQQVKPREVTGSFNQVDMKQFERKMTSDITTAIEGLTPSLVISNNPSTNSKTLTIRGISTLEGETAPLIVVDDFPYNGDLKSINPYDIESITLLKDAATASIYGAKSANGVIVITTKKGYNNKNLEVRYSRNYQMFQKPNLDYRMNRVSSKDLVDIQTNYFNQNKNNPDFKSYQSQVLTNNSGRIPNPRAINKVLQLQLAHREGRISQQELETGLSTLRRADNTKDLEKLLIQNPIISQHNIVASYGTENFRLRTSLNYTDGNTMKKGTKDNAINYNLNSTIELSERAKLDLLANFRMSEEESYRGKLNDFFNLSSYERFYGSANNALAVTKPYQNLGTNNNGNYGGKDSYAIKELIDLGLLDETYYPATDYGLSKNFSETWVARFQAQMKIRLFEGLSTNLGVNIRRENSNSRKYISNNSWEMKSFINNLTVKEDKNPSGILKKGKLLVPLGGRLDETRADKTSYLFRGQLEYKKDFNNHNLTALLGSEIQSIKSTSTSVDRLGYDIRNNIFKQVDYGTLGQTITQIFLPDGTVAEGIDFNNKFGDIENRFFSLYTNAVYSYDNTYIISGSARIDQSNLFGTDPRYRYKPFWSVAGKWNVDRESFFNPNDFVSRLSLQASYGTNGNISNKFGPYDIAEAGFAFRANQAKALRIISYAVPDLRWETTGTFNVGVSTTLFKERLNLSFDYYRKLTKDVLATVEADPTIAGTNFIIRNDASITNNGYELTLSSRNIHTDDFTWRSFLNYRFNNSKVEKIYKRDERATTIAGKVRNRLDYEPNSIFVFDWAGVDDKGNGLVRIANGDLVKLDDTFKSDNLVDKDLKYAGTTIPKTVLGFTNNFEYKNMMLSFLLVYQGGHVMKRDSYDGGVIGKDIFLVNNEASLAWKKAGDETTTVVPRLGANRFTSVASNSTKNILPADFLALRDIVFSYTIHKEFLEKLKVKEITLNVKGTNLYKWTKNKYGIDPETQGLGIRRFYTPKSISTGFILTF